MTSISVITLVRGRPSHLANTLDGLCQQSLPPDEIIVAAMQEEGPEIPKTLRGRTSVLQIPGDKLPLAAARNAAASKAGGDILVCLDVDCRPHPDFLRAAKAASGKGRILMADCRYLSADDPGHLPFEELWERAERHPARLKGSLDDPPSPIGDMGEFWSLAFALPRTLYERAGGFDERFVGYGGEDTDFAVSLAEAQGQLFFVPAMRAVHQWHEVRKPPLHHFSDILRNAERFRRKRGRWCMDYWLSQFEEAGLIEVGETEIEVLRTPSADELEAARQPRSVRFS